MVLFDIMEILEGVPSFFDEKIEEALFVIIKYEDTYFGVILSELVNTKELSREEVIQVSDTKEFYKGTFKYDEQIVYILDFKKIIERSIIFISFPL